MIFESPAILRSSLEEGGPMMVPESMLCGAMVVGFETGFLETDDFIQSGINGWRVPVGDSVALAKSLADSILLSSKQRNVIINNAQEVALNIMSDKAFIQEIKKHL